MNAKNSVQRIDGIALSRRMVYTVMDIKHGQPGGSAAIVNNVNTAAALVVRGLAVTAGKSYLMTLTPRGERIYAAIVAAYGSTCRQADSLAAAETEAYAEYDARAIVTNKVVIFECDVCEGPCKYRLCPTCGGHSEHNYGCPVAMPRPSAVKVGFFERDEAMGCPVCAATPGTPHSPSCEDPFEDVCNCGDPFCQV